MSTPDPEDASNILEYSCDPDVQVDIDAEEEEEEEEEADMAAETKSEQHSGTASPVTKKPASNAKDPTRPRRKKARRACLSCQRAHLTCGDERPCNRCTSRNLQDSCMDGVRKKAKYVHDVPDGALMPGMDAHYSHMHRSRPIPLPTQDQATMSLAHQAYYTHAPSTTYYPPSTVTGPIAPIRDSSYNATAPLSPPYRQNQAPMLNAPPPVSQSSQPMQQFGGPLFDPSDPALFNFDISGLNFGNHYGALELGMLGHMSSGAVEAPTSDDALNQAAGMYNPQIAPGTYGEHPAVSAQMPFGPEAMSTSDWQNPHSRNGSTQIQTPNNTPVTAHMDHGGHRHDSLSGPHAYAIGQGSSSLSSHSPASVDLPSSYENDNPMVATAYFANSNQPRLQQSPVQNRPHQVNHMFRGPLKPVQYNSAMRNRDPEGKSIYERITQPYNYVAAFHRLIAVLEKRFCASSYRRAQGALGVFRPVLMSNAAHLDNEDLIYAEKNLQRSLITMHASFAEVGTPCLICRRTGEVVGMNKEFEILTGWKREVLLGYAPNLNANMGPSVASPDTEPLGRANTTPILPGQEPDSGPHAVNILELMDEPSAVQYLDDFADLAIEDPLGKGHRRVHMLRYLTKEEMTQPGSANGQHMKREPRIKNENSSLYQGEAAMRRNLGTNGLIDAMIMWHIKRDNFDMPMLVAMQIMPMLN